MSTVSSCHAPPMLSASVGAERQAPERGNNPNFSVDMAVSNATHATLTYNAADNAVSSITVNLPTMHISILTGAGVSVDATRWRATATLTVVDNNGAPVVGATVTVTSAPQGDGNGRQLSCTTDALGTCSVQSGRINVTTASATMTVSNATHATLSYNAAANVVSSITVNRL